MSRRQDVLGFHGRVMIKRQGGGELALIVQHVGLIGEGQDVVGVVCTAGALNAVRKEIGEVFGIRKLAELAQHAAQKVRRAERVGVLGFEDTGAIVHIFP